MSYPRTHQISLLHIHNLNLLPIDECQVVAKLI
uniref:Uncharacterized protein n=1 Tax=Rhizophora mucronata TaxID=61149 RepID=A0A2P2PF02_RHIMU